MGAPAKKDSCCKMVMKFLFSHIGLCSMVVLYSVAGGFIFEHLEKNNEQQICYDARAEYEPMESKTISSTMKIFYDYGGAITTNASRELMIIQLQSVLQTFRNNTLAIAYDGSWCGLYGKDNGPNYKWSWAGAVLFAVTVITTIGYGHIAPKTVWGRLVCIAYAVLGIPLMLLCLANLGDALADIFRFIYAKICCCGCFKGKKKSKESNNKVVSLKNSDSNNAGQWDSDKKNLADMTNSSPPASTEFTRISTSSPTDSMDMSDTRKLRPTSSNSSRGKVKIVPLDLKKNDPVILDDDSDSDDDDDDIDEKITVPLTITMIVIGGYIFGGAVLFGLWEGWDWLQSAYFCFITLSTIGFGDVVPGTDFENPQAQAQLLLGSVYVLFGMAILSMCFSLMQEEILAKARWIGQKLGLVEKEADD
ncbi:TWiK family of potassium channels protein 18-like [Physella acuta]|uniref:TWiK family of potassium channels protein 18-like n=1 Tax=Physella acuta TaxID=109671 RepID=UPI0027DB5356|nr:TWiK family of potassium channels protein 18-like [Physella acuta]